MNLFVVYDRVNDKAMSEAKGRFAASFLLELIVANSARNGKRLVLELREAGEITAPTPTALTPAPLPEGEGSMSEGRFMEDLFGDRFFEVTNG